MEDPTLCDLIDASRHLSELINHCGSGHIDADTAKRRFLLYLGDTDPAERARMHVEHFVIPDAISLTPSELVGLGTRPESGPWRDTHKFAKESIKARLGYSVDLVDGRPVRE